MKQAAAPGPYEHGLTTLSKYFLEFDDATLAVANESFRAAVALDAADARAWTALGFVLDAAGQPADALDALRTAARLDPSEHDVEVFILTLLSEAGAESEAIAGIEAAAGRAGVDLPSLRSDLSAAGMPTDSRALLLNGFIRPRNFVRSRLEDAIERLGRRRDPAAWKRRQAAERRECRAMQAELQRLFDVDRVPEPLRSLAPWALRLGVGDDHCRGWLVGRLKAAEREELRRRAEDHAGAIQRWLDSFPAGSMPEEAAAFMYLMLGVEEMDIDPVGGAAASP